MEKYAMFKVIRGNGSNCDHALYSTDIVFLKKLVCEIKSRFAIKKENDNIEMDGSIDFIWKERYLSVITHFVSQFLCLNGWEPYYKETHFRKKIE